MMTSHQSLQARYEAWHYARYYAWTRQYDEPHKGVWWADNALVVLWCVAFLSSLASLIIDLGLWHPSL